MKKLLFLTIIISISILFSNVWAGITGSKHDFASETWNSSGEICITCHTPHNAAVAQEPLWNHAVTTATFTLYDSTTLDATPGQPGATSKLCLSCHDGTVALEAYGGVTTELNMISGSALIGTDLSNDHPISVTYDTALASLDGGLYDPNTATTGLGGTIDADLLFANQVQCASCHDVHREDESISFLLKIDNASSALCLTCHNK